MLKIPISAWKVSARSHARLIGMIEDIKTIATITTRRIGNAILLSVINLRFVSLIE